MSIATRHDVFWSTIIRFSDISLDRHKDLHKDPAYLKSRRSLPQSNLGLTALLIGGNRALTKGGNDTLWLGQVVRKINDDANLSRTPENVKIV